MAEFAGCPDAAGNRDSRDATAQYLFCLKDEVYPFQVSKLRLNES